MKEIVLCDRSLRETASNICRKYGVAVNVDAFTETEKYRFYKEELCKIKRNYKDINILSLHGPYKDLCLGSRDNLIRKVTMMRFEFIYIIAKLLDCHHIILHHGYIPGTSSPDRWLQRAHIFFNEFLDGKEDICFYIENQFEKNPELIAEVVSQVNDKRLKACLDIGHANCNSDLSPLAWIRKLNKQIGFVHMHNNFGVTDQHLSLKIGNLNIEEICDSLEEYYPDSIWAIETNSMEHAEESLKWFIEHHYLTLNIS